MTSIDMKSVICGGCNMVASLDDDGLCEFCRRRPGDGVEPDARRIAWFFVLKIAAVAVVFGLIVLGIVTGGQ